MASVGGATTPASEKFEEAKFMKELINLKETQDAVQCLSGWCIRNRKFSYKIARCWLKCAKKVKTEQRLTLFYLLNDVVQHSKRKNYDDLLDKFEAILKEIMPYMKEEKISEKVERCLNIWSERNVFNEKFVAELLSIIKQNRAEQDLIDNFQPQQLCTQIKIMRALEDDTDYKLKTLRDADLNLVEMDEASLRQSLKDRQHGSDFIHDVDEGKQRLEQYIKAVDREINKRRQVIELLTHGSKYYESLLGEANIVANAYSNFGKRIKTLQHKLVEDRLPKLQVETKQALLAAADLSPIPSPDYDAPSPKSGELELVLPDEKLQQQQQEQQQLEQQQQQQQEQQKKQEQEQSRYREKSPEDLNSRLDSMRSQMAANVSGIPAFDHPAQGVSINEFLTKLATGEQHHLDVVAVPTPVIHAPAPVSLPLASVGVYSSSAPVYPPPLEQEHLWWDPPPATAWPAPKPDPWTDPEAEPIPEWQIQTEDDIPDDDGEEIYSEPEAYTQNLALQRLQQNAVKVAKLDEKPTNNLISLTAGGDGGPVKSHVTNHVGGTEDMEMCSDEDDEYNPHHSRHHQQQRHHTPSQHQVPQPPKPPKQQQKQHGSPENNFPENGSSPMSSSFMENSSSSFHGEEKRTMTLQERLRSLAGINTDDDKQFFSPPPPPRPVAVAVLPSTIQTTSPLVPPPPPPSSTVFSPLRPPPLPRPPNHQNFHPLFEFEQSPDRRARAPFHSSGFQPRPPQQQFRPRFEHGNNFHPFSMRGGRARPPGPRW